MNRERWAVADYEKVARAWNPDAYDPRKWVETARRAGMKYIVCTTKHHDGNDQEPRAVGVAPGHRGPALV